MRAHTDSKDLAAYYDELLDEQERSGLSVTEFAEGAGVSAATLYSWRRRLRGGGARPKLMEVRLVEEPETADGTAALTLHVDDRFSIEVPADFDTGALERLLGVLDRC